MKQNHIFKKGLLLMLSLGALLVSGCKQQMDDRPFQDVRIVGVKVNSKLYLPQYTPTDTKVVLPAGTQLDRVKVEVLVANGELIDFPTTAVDFDARKPVAITLKSYNGGGNVQTKLRIQSPPKLTDFYVAELSLALKDVYESPNSIIAQVPPTTNMTALTASIGFANGKLIDFVNGMTRDFTQPILFNVMGVDEETVYAYKFILTTEPVGPATIKSVTIAGVTTDSVKVDDKGVATLYIPALMNFTSCDLTIEAGLNNVIDPSSKLVGLNLLKGDNKVKILGTNGISTEFTIGVPKLSLRPLLSKTYSSIITGGADGLSSCALAADGTIIMASHQAPVGPLSMNADGTGIVALSRTGSNIDGGAVTGIRKITTDDSGVILGVQLGAGAGAAVELAIWKWSSATANPEKYISYTQASLGLAYAPRAAGINVTGSLSGDAKIVVPIAQKSDVFVWTVTGGVLNAVPTKLSYPSAYPTGYYYSVQPMPIGTTGFFGASTGATFNGLINLTTTMDENFKNSGIVTTDCKVVTRNGRTYLAYTAFASGKGAYLRICDITENNLFAIQNPIMDELFASTSGNGNNTLDADFQVINGKLYVVFCCSNIGLRVYQLEK